MTVYIAISIVLAFFIPILSAMVVQKIVDKKPYTIPIVAISLFLSCPARYGACRHRDIYE